MRNRASSTVQWAAAGALALAITWGAGARADDAVVQPDASKPMIAPIVPTTDFSLDPHGQIGVGERVRETGSSARKDLIHKRTPKEVIERSRGNDSKSDAGQDPGTGNGSQLQIGTPLDTQPISIGYAPVGTGPTPVCPEPSGFALLGIGLVGLLASRQRKN